MKKDDDIGRIIKYFRARKEVSVLYLFGSLVENRKTAESDIDIAVLVDEGKLRKVDHERLKEAYYHASPGFSLRPVDIVVLNTAPPYLKHRILKTGRILFDRNRRLRVKFTTDAIIEYLDFKPLEDIFHRAVAGRFRRASVGR
jgi:predicted nucleotidyltransferase